MDHLYLQPFFFPLFEQNHPHFLAGAGKMGERYKRSFLLVCIVCVITTRSAWSSGGADQKNSFM